MPTGVILGGEMGRLNAKTTFQTPDNLIVNAEGGIPFRMSIGDFKAQSGISKTILVNEKSDFGTAVSDVITLEDKVQYELIAPIDMGTTSLKVPDDGQNLIKARNELFHTLTSNITDGAAFITGALNRLLLENLVIFGGPDGVGTNAVLFDLIAPVDVPFRVFFTGEIRYQGFASIGTITGITIITRNVAMINMGDGLTIVDPGGISTSGQGVLMEATNFLSQSGDHIILSGNCPLCRFDGVNAEPATGDAMFDIDSAIDTFAGRVTNCSFSAVGGGDFTKAGSVNSTSINFIFSDNPGQEDSRALAFGFTNANTTTTSITDGAYIAIDASTFVASPETERYTLDSATTAAFEYEGLEPFNGFLTGSLTAVKTISTENYRFTMSRNGIVPLFADIASTTITGVTDSSGIASFTHAGTTPPIDTTVTISGFVTNTAYNQTDVIVTASSATTFEVSSIAFGSDETGSFTANQANYIPMEVKQTKVNIPLEFSVVLETGDTVQIMVAGDGTGNDLTITDLVFGIK